MQVECGVCGSNMEYSGARPSFCGYCGKPLTASIQEATGSQNNDATATHPPGADATPDPVDQPPQIRGYRLLELLGKGGMGAVYQAEDLSSGRRVAVKVISQEYASAATTVERFRQEGRLASLISHPRCVFVLAADEDAGRPYIVMELMSGATLQELVERDGPLTQREAVAKILDVIEGLKEAHRLGVIHRDVKPSNCFVLKNGRVKVGDFGLAKSLINTNSLTRTGTFLGTLLYAPPEQIKGETIDVRTDVYSVCATVYFLLTGRAPYQSKDAAATLARTVSEPPPPLRSLRRGLSPVLEKIILRGLSRKRDERWRDLEELRLALLPFAPGQLRPAGYAIRLGAFLLDVLIFLPFWICTNLFLESRLVDTGAQAVLLLGLRILDLAPWWFLEGWWGWSPGKWLLNLRVCTPGGSDPPGVGRAALRVLVFYMFLWLLPDVFALLMGKAQGFGGLMFTPMSCLEVLGAIPLLVTMRASSGYRGLHEWLSGTRVVRLPWPERQRSLTSRHADRLKDLAPCPADLPEHLGSFDLRGVLCTTDEVCYLLGEDPALGRTIWLRLEQASNGGLTNARRHLIRPTRLPWLTGGVAAGRAWDAFLAPSGCPLADLVDRGRPLTWGETRPLLLQLCEELMAAEQEDTLPARLSLPQVWVQPNGRLQLLDTPFPQAERSADVSSPLALLRVVRVALEGQWQRAGAHRHVCAPVPGRAAALLDRLVGGAHAYQTVAEVHEDLTALEGQPTQINRTLRSAHLALLSAALTPILLGLFSLRFVVLLTFFVLPQEQENISRRALKLLDKEETQAAFLAQLNRLQPQPQRTLGQWRELLELRYHEAQSDAEQWREAVHEDWLARTFLGAMANEIARDEGQPKDSELLRILQRDSAEQQFLLAPMTMGLAIFLWIYIGLCVLWALLFRGGFTLGLVGMVLRRRNGRPAARWQCAGRTLLFWLPVGVFLSLSLLVLVLGPQAVPWSLMFWWLAAAVLASYLPFALWLPARSLHDRLLGTYLMPS